MGYDDGLDDPSRQSRYNPLDIEQLSRASEMMELMPDQLSVRIIGLVCDDGFLFVFRSLKFF